MPNTKRPAEQNSNAMELYLAECRPDAFKDITGNRYPDDVREDFGNIINTWIRGKTPNSLFIMGGLGTGKSSALWLMHDAFYRSAWQIISREECDMPDPQLFMAEMRCGVGMYSHFEIADSLQQLRKDSGEPMSFSSRKPSRDTLFVLQAGCVVLIDEWGLIPKEYDNKSMVRMAQWIDWRWQWRLPTVIATNMTREELEADPLHARIFDRFTDDRWAMVYTLGGESKRRQPSGNVA